MAPSHHLDQFYLIVKEVLRHSLTIIFPRSAQEIINPQNEFENVKIPATSAWGQFSQDETSHSMTKSYAPLDSFFMYYFPYHMN